MSEPKYFVIKRSEWTGQNAYQDAGCPQGNGLKVTNDDGSIVKRCCLGFYAEACGIPNISGAYIYDPNSNYLFGGGIASSYAASTLASGGRYNQLADFAASINDATNEDDETKEAMITQLFAENGIIVEFVD